MKKAILLLGHGSRLEAANKSLTELCRLVEKKSQTEEIIAHAYLQFASPGLVEALDSLDARQVEEVIIVPVFLYEGVHFKEDILGFLEGEVKHRPHMRLLLAPILGFDDRMAEVILDRVSTARKKD